VQPRQDGAGPKAASPVPGPAAGRGAWRTAALGWWKAALASFFWSVLGIPIGAVAAVAAFVLLLLVSRGGVGSSDGSGWAGLVFVPTFGAVVAFLLGFAIPLFRHARNTRRRGSVGRGPFARAAAGAGAGVPAAHLDRAVDIQPEAGSLGQDGGPSTPRG
jgi:hypothetical protein